MKKRIGDYILQEEISKCSCGVVYKSMLEHTNKFFAIKMLRKMDMNLIELECSENELTILQVLNHDNIVRIQDVKKSANNYYIIFDYYEGGTLQQHLNKKTKLEEIEVRDITRQIVSALKELYKLLGTHRNLKLSKVFLTYTTDNHLVVKLGGFRLSHIENIVKPYYGDLDNVGPEIKIGKEYTIASDIWSLGSMVYEMLTGLKLETHGNKFIHKINTASYISIEALDFIFRCTKFKSTERINWDDLTEHLFLTNKTTELDIPKFIKEYLHLKNIPEFINLDSDCKYQFDLFVTSKHQSMEINTLIEEEKKSTTPLNKESKDLFEGNFIIGSNVRKEEDVEIKKLNIPSQKSMIYNIDEMNMRDTTIPKKRALDEKEALKKSKRHKNEESEDVINSSDFEFIRLDSSGPIKTSKELIKEAENEFTVKTEGKLNIEEDHFT